MAISSPDGGLRRAARSAPALVLATMVAACSPKVPPPAAAPAVLAALPVLANAEGAVAYSGEVRARYESPLSFRIDGKLVARLVHLGDFVHAGQELARIDPGDTAATLEAARAALAAAESRLVLARQQRDRNMAQLEGDLISRADADQSETGLAVARAEVEQRRQDLALAGNQSQYTHVLADHDGWITAENADVGAVLKAGQPVLSLAWSGPVDVWIDVPETRIAALSRGQAAQVRTAATAATPLHARVRDIAAAADPQSRTFRVKLGLDTPGQARLGGTAVVVFPAAGAKRLRLPATALFHDGQVSAVWVVRNADHTLELRKVEVAGYGADSVDIASGLEAQDTVVVQGVHAVNAGERVTVLAPRAGDSAAAATAANPAANSPANSAANSAGSKP